MDTGARLLSEEHFLLITLIVKLAVAATLATMLVRFGWFRRILLTEKRDWPERLIFAAGWGIPLTAGVAARLLLDYQATDLTLSGAYLAGLVAGPYAGAIVGAAVGIPPLFAGEYGALPFAVGCGFAGGGLREICPKEQIWHFSPFFVTKLHRSVWRVLRRLSLDWQMILVTAPVLLEVIRQTVGSKWGAARLFYLSPDAGAGLSWMTLLVLLTTVLGVAIPIKIWNSARIEHRLAEQEKLLMTARVQALANQINPHFLFNTLTSISSLIRSQPETARVLIVKLSGLLRRLLRSQDHFVPLREELAAVDEYLDIERVRFGPSLVVDKHIDPSSLDLIVPSMILQPLVENSIKHGLSRKLGEGRILIRTSHRAGHAVIEVIDNGVGMPADRLDSPSAHGIGLRNVNERLSVIYGTNYQLKLESTPGQGTSARIEIPELVVPEAATA
ncbi:MAG TPA: histidine kinase [Vicinamibacterales bacterium]|nr:histidine kinase [Vicinamibacterales bacterium]